MTRNEDLASYAADYEREWNNLTDDERDEFRAQAERDHAAAYGAYIDQDLPLPTGDIPEDEIEF